MKRKSEMVVARLCELAEMHAIAGSARAMMRLSLLDWCACAIAGADEPAARIVRDMVLAEGGAGIATLVGDGRAPMRGAALVNGTASHALDYDDTHFGHIGHPSVAVIPAALASAERCGASGAEFLDSALIGAEASIRVGMWLGRSHYEAGFHQTATAGAFGATLAAGRLLKLDRDQLAQAISLVSSRASGLRSQFGSMGKPLNAGIAAANGVEAAQLAQAGFRSDQRALAGENGFSSSHAGAEDMTAFDGLGQDWLFEGITHKFHACCHGLHAALEALQHIPAGDVASVEITTHPRWRDVCDIAEPVDGLQAKFSYRLTAAMVLCSVSTADRQNFSAETAVEPRLVAMRDRVSVRFDPQLPETAARVQVRMRDGAERRARHDLADGITLPERAERLHAKAALLVGQGRAKALWVAIEAGPDLPGLLTVLND